MLFDLAAFDLGNAKLCVTENGSQGIVEVMSDPRSQLPERPQLVGLQGALLLALLFGDVAQQRDGADQLVLLIEQRRDVDSEKDALLVQARVPEPRFDDALFAQGRLHRQVFGRDPQTMVVCELIRRRVMRGGVVRAVGHSEHEAGAAVGADQGRLGVKDQ